MNLKKATPAELPIIWQIIQYAIAQRKQDSSDQWQDGYPNETTLQQDLDKSNGYLVVEDDMIMAYAAIIFEKEPAYDYIKGQWLTNGDYAVVHRVAASPLAKGKSIATKLFLIIEDLCKDKKVYSIKVDTNFDNIPMLKILKKLNYIYCGEVYFRGSARKAFEKVLL